MPRTISIVGRWLTLVLTTVTLAHAETLPAPATAELPGDYPFTATAYGTFEDPWAMTFLPDGRLLVTEQPGILKLLDLGARTSTVVAGTPEVAYKNQGGLGDIVLHPDFADNRTLYVSFAEEQGGKRGAVVNRYTLVEDSSGTRLEDAAEIWRQIPFVTGAGHYGHRMAFSEDGYLFISSGERQKFDPSQDMQSNLGKVVRLNPDGSVPDDNPFYGKGGATDEIWSLGHRNPLGLAFDTDGQLWNTEMGPRHGDELNRVVARNNYGYPLVSNGNHYNGKKIPDHDTRPDLDPPAAYWVPAISPGSLMIYSGKRFSDWNGNAFIGALSGKALVRVALAADGAKEVERYPMGERIREVEQGPEGAIWLLEDGGERRLLKLTPR
ncbi:MAG: PQQ-dependent sugar dehydrogenase [Pseudomonadota bacterium]